MHSPFRLSPLLFAPAIFAFACTVEPNPNSTSSTASSSSSSSTSGEAGSGGFAGAGGMAGGTGGMATGGAAGSGGAMAMAPKPDFGLVDVNPNSVTSGKTISPRDYTGQISAWYFGHATWSYCSGQFGYMNQMQGEIDSMLGGVPGSKVQFLGINQTGFESGNVSVTNGRTIPWLQDTAEQQVWTSWAITFRDVVILDAENKPIAVYNVTINNLGDPTKYTELKQILLDAAATLP